ncbi:SPFH domain-containing protein [Lacrimispora sp. NSJ-141]|uniref:SPFH domain-containing protein n=1 Tax=Lientehia hominis TaxID=2897778 RepID=A0AAP2RH19_9FIRM|nr:SPFH domain-containing protein [Lientehia hominis]MCD2492074.1 SPFH domain-containing protein [Lientehia hominis]
MKGDFSKERELSPASGMVGLLMAFLLLAGGTAVIICSALFLKGPAFGILLAVGILLVCAVSLPVMGLKVVAPKEALVLVLFGTYYGTIRQEGFYLVNPFCMGVNPSIRSTPTTIAGGNIQIGTSFSKKVSLKTMTLNNEKQKVNDQLGNPVIVGAVVIWKVVNPTKAVFNVNNYKTFLSIQCDSVIRNVSRLYPYDIGDDGSGSSESDEKTLRGSTREVAGKMCYELQERVKDAGLEISDVQITHLSYAPEIASAMLQRQQAVAIIAARQKIVEGAVGMVEMALEKLNENDVVELDEERKAAMVSNLLVVLCGNKDAQPIVNSGSIY